MQEGIQTVVVVGFAAGTFMYGISFFVAIVNNRHEKAAKRHMPLSEPITIKVPEELGVYQARSSMIQADL